MPFWVFSRGLWCCLMSSQQRCDGTSSVSWWLSAGLWGWNGPDCAGCAGERVSPSAGQRDSLVLHTLTVWAGNTWTWTWTNTLDDSHIRATWNAYYSPFSLVKPVHFRLFFMWWKTFKVILTHLKKMPSVSLVMQKIPPREWVVMLG